MTTKTKPKLRTLPEWFELIYARYGNNGTGMIAIEQAYYQSERHKVCVDCLGSNFLVHQTERQLVKSTDYYMCQTCLDWWAKKE